MSGDLWDQIYYLSEQVEIFVNQLMHTMAKKNDVLYTYQASFIKMMEYPLTVITSISESQWNSIMAPVIKMILQKTGFSATFPRDIFFGPITYQGFGCHHPYYHQESLHVMTLVNENYNKMQTGQLLMVSLEELVCELGVDDPLYRILYGMYEPCITNSWLQTLCHFMNQHEISMEGFVVPPPTLRKYKNVYLVSSFVSNGYRGKESQTLNQIWQSIHAVTLSNIATADRKQVRIQPWQATGSNRIQQDVEWPQKIPVSAASLFLRQQAICKCFLKPYFPPNSQSLTNPLSTRSNKLVTCSWQWWYSALEDRLHHCNGVIWLVFSCIGIHRHNNFHYLHPTMMKKPVSANMPALVFPQGTRYWMNSCVPLSLDILPSVSEIGTPLQTLIAGWIVDLQFLLEQVHIPDDGCIDLAQGMIQSPE
jgi:hypothetical protein